MPDQEPTVSVSVVEYVHITYGGKTLTMPRDEAYDLVPALARLLPDDIGAKK